MSATRETVIVPSGRCSVEWLCKILTPRWFGGDATLLYEPTTRDLRPVLVDYRGANVTGRA